MKLGAQNQFQMIKPKISQFFVIFFQFMLAHLSENIEYLAFILALHYLPYVLILMDSFELDATSPPINIFRSIIHSAT